MLVTRSAHLHKLLSVPLKPFWSSRALKQDPPQAVFLEKCLEEPIVVVAESNAVDIIGPPDRISNLRPVIRSFLRNETILQQKLREMQDMTQEWNQKFWTEHNTNFIKEQEKYVKLKMFGRENKVMTTEEMSEFYKEFLDKHWETHVRYNFTWYKRNFQLLVLAFRVSLERKLLKIKNG